MQLQHSNHNLSFSVHSSSCDAIRYIAYFFDFTLLLIQFSFQCLDLKIQVSLNFLTSYIRLNFHRAFHMFTLFLQFLHLWNNYEVTMPEVKRTNPYESSSCAAQHKLYSGRSYSSANYMATSCYICYASRHSNNGRSTLCTLSKQAPHGSTNQTHRKKPWKLA